MEFKLRTIQDELVRMLSKSAVAPEARIVTTFTNNIVHKLNADVGTYQYHTGQRANSLSISTCSSFFVLDLNPTVRAAAKALSCFMFKPFNVMGGRGILFELIISTSSQ